MSSARWAEPEVCLLFDLDTPNSNASTHAFVGTDAGFSHFGPQ